MRGIRAAAVGGVVAGLCWFAPAAAQAQVIADWQMNEDGPHATVMADSSGNGLDGDVGGHVVTGETTPDGGRAYRFQGDWRIVDDTRLVTVPDSATPGVDDTRLDPGTGTYAVTIRFKTGALDPNIIQKGQANQTGGYWKLALQHGWPRCHFRDASGTTRAIGFVNDSRPQAMVADNAWHTLRCERTATGVKLTIDYGSANAISKSIKGTLGGINNKRPLSIGGKLDCDGSKVTCDYFAGAVDWVRIERP